MGRVRTENRIGLKPHNCGIYVDDMTYWVPEINVSFINETGEQTWAYTEDSLRKQWLEGLSFCAVAMKGTTSNATARFVPGIILSYNESRNSYLINFDTRQAYVTYNGWDEHDVPSNTPFGTILVFDTSMGKLRVAAPDLENDPYGIGGFFCRYLGHLGRDIKFKLMTFDFGI